MRTTDWPAILRLANAAVEHVPGAGSQEAWLNNRRHFDLTTGVQHQCIVELQDSSLVGYGAVESDGTGEFRLFLVTEPHHLTSVGERLYSYGLDVLRELRARTVWFTEYAADAPLLAFALDRGFQEARRFALADGVEAITLKRELDE